MMNCDPETGVCLIPDLEDAAPTPPVRTDGAAVRYVGDPMCSWCWGISPAVHAIAAFCATHGIEFTITPGGLRAGGGDPWTDGFKSFLRQEWGHIAEVTGQPFGYNLLSLAYFNYDTEPACRAVVTMQMLAVRQGLPMSAILDAFADIQRKFYVEGQDPKDVAFYADICGSAGIDFGDFQALFASPAARDATEQAFRQCRAWGVRSFPTLLIEKAGTLSPLSVGFVDKAEALNRLREAFDLAPPAR